MSSTGSSRGNPSMGDIVRSVAVLGALVLALWGFGQLFTKTPDSNVKPIDYVSTVRSARPAAEFALLAPATLPKGWVATSAQFTPTTWHLGVVTDDEEYVGLEQRTGDAKQLVATYAKDSTAAGEVTIDGETWNLREGPDGEVTFVRTESGLTTLVTGEAPRAEVEAYVASLSAS
ncbi:hypothetical protein J2X11_001000 [Aeromicrobium panaciterrae]|uniref:DUF4245 domain-containing protein n=1 Tax=Aeromicrobium panaciterrae TaxID=363861 RepID=A0ABU1ULW3_9ACTN|nr:DUF4245 domain-containing protein [Aeromicrobium panaciterrae]MDR7086161.1 hypothetical protein [Aeromicrobium panaciterrae]